MSEKDQNVEGVEDLLTKILEEGVETNIKEENVTEDIFTEKISSDVLTFLTNNETENFTEVEDEDFEKLFRMSKNTFFDLQHELQNTSENYDTNLLTSLWILGNLAPFKDISKILSLEEDYIKQICKKYYRSIINLSPKYISWPSASDMLTLEYMFKKEYEFPRIIGALGCIYITVQNEKIESDSYFHLNFGNNTIILQAVCDSNLLFRDVFLGHSGCKSVTDVLKSSPLYKKLTNQESLLKRTSKHLLGGTEHPQLDTLLTPYPFNEETNLNKEQLKFNTLHSAAMSVLDKTFFIIENRFQRMKCLETVDYEFANLALGAICVLHNFTRVRGDNLNF